MHWRHLHHHRHRRVNPSRQQILIERQGRQFVEHHSKVVHRIVVFWSFLSPPFPLPGPIPAPWPPLRLGTQAPSRVRLRITPAQTLRACAVRVLPPVGRISAAIVKRNLIQVTQSQRREAGCVCKWSVCEGIKNLSDIATVEFGLATVRLLSIRGVQKSRQMPIAA